MEIFLRNQDQVNRVLWFNSVPARFKKEILNQLIKQKVDLKAKGQYKIIVDYGPTGNGVTATGPTSIQDETSVKRRKQKDKRLVYKSSISPKKSGEPQTTIMLPQIDQKHLQQISSPTQARQQNITPNAASVSSQSQSMSPIRVKIEQVEDGHESDSKAADGFTYHARCGSQPLLSYGQEYEMHLTKTAKPFKEGQTRRSTDDNQFVTLPNKLWDHPATTKAANRVMEKHEKKNLRRIREEQMTRQRSEAQDSWKDFTQNVMKLGSKKGIEFQKRVDFRNSSELKMLTEQHENLLPKFPQVDRQLNREGDQTMQNTISMNEAAFKAGKNFFDKNEIKVIDENLKHGTSLDHDVHILQDEHYQILNLNLSESVPKLLLKESSQNSSAIDLKPQLPNLQFTSEQSRSVENLWQIPPSSIDPSRALASNFNAQPNSLQSAQPQSKSKMRPSGSQILDRKGASSANVSNLPFTAETYADKKKLLNQMIEALKVAKQAKKEEKGSMSNKKRKIKRVITFNNVQITEEESKVVKTGSQNSQSNLEDIGSPVMVDIRCKDASVPDTKENYFRIRRVTSQAEIKKDEDTATHKVRHISQSKIGEQELSSKDDLHAKRPTTNASCLSKGTLKQAGSINFSNNHSSTDNYVKQAIRKVNLPMPKPKTVQEYINQHQKRKNATWKPSQERYIIDKKQVSKQEDELTQRTSGWPQERQANDHKQRIQNSVHALMLKRDKKREMNKSSELKKTKALNQKAKSYQTFQTFKEMANLTKDCPEHTEYHRRQQTINTKRILNYQDGKMTPISSTSEASVKVEFKSGKQEVSPENLMKEAIQNSSISQKDFNLEEKQSIITNVQKSSNQNRSRQYTPSPDFEVRNPGQQLTAWKVQTDVGLDQRMKIMLHQEAQMGSESATDQGTFLRETFQGRSSQITALEQHKYEDSPSQNLPQNNFEDQMQKVKIEQEAKPLPESSSDSEYGITKQSFNDQFKTMPVIQPVKKGKTITINYFGNIQDSLIGQIKTKIPMPFKKEHLRSFNSSPTRQHFQTVNHDPIMKVSHSVQSLHEGPALATDSYQPENSQTSVHQQENSKIFYANIGREPYMVNRYMRPKGLTSYKVIPDTNEADLEFLKRKQMHQLEKDKKSQWQIMRNQKAAIRGSMLKDPSIFLSSLRKNANKEYKTEMRSRHNMSLKTASSQPVINMPAGHNEGHVTISKKAAAKILKKQRKPFNEISRGLSYLKTGKIQPQKPPPIIQKSQSQQLIMTTPTPLKQSEQITEQMVQKNMIETLKIDDEQQSKKRHLEVENVDVIESELVTTRQKLQHLSSNNKFDLDLANSRQNRNSQKIKTNLSSVNESPIRSSLTMPNNNMLAQFVKKEQHQEQSSLKPPTEEGLSASDQGQDIPSNSRQFSPFQKQAKYESKNDQLEAYFEVGESALKDQDVEIRVQNEQEQALMNKTGNFGNKFSNAQSSRTLLAEDQNQGYISPDLQNMQREVREPVYSSIAKIQKAGSYRLNQIHSRSGKKSRISTQKQLKEQREAVLLNQSSRKFEFDVNQFAHSQVEHIRSFVKKQHEEKKGKPPTLLNRGAGRFLGKGTMFKGLETSAQKKKRPPVLFAKEPQAISLVTDMALNSQERQDDSDSNLFKSISQLTKPNEEKEFKLKKQLKMNQQQFRNPVAFAHRQISKIKKGSEKIPTEESADFRQFAIEKQDQGEIYLKFLKYKQQRDSLTLPTDDD